MDLSDSGYVKNNVKPRSVVIAIFVHLYLAVFTVGVSLILLAISVWVTKSWVNREVTEASSARNRFKKNFPFNYYGQSFGSFQHVFSHSEIIEESMYQAIEAELTSNTPVKSMEAISITDVDKDLSQAEDRTFIKAESTNTVRGTTVTLILGQSNFGKMQSIEWRVLAGGYIDQDKKFNLYAYSLFTILFWIIPYLKKEHNLLGRVRTIYAGAYNDMDVATQIRCLHDAVFNAMINELESHGIDTSELKAQKMQVMNISISGGKVSMGNVVQGAMNKVTSTAKGARA